MPRLIIDAMLIAPFLFSAVKPVIEGGFRDTHILPNLNGLKLGLLTKRVRPALADLQHIRHLLNGIGSLLLIDLTSVGILIILGCHDFSFPCSLKLVARLGPPLSSIIHYAARLWLQFSELFCWVLINTDITQRLSITCN